MLRKLKAIAVDDSELFLSTLKLMTEQSPLVEITHTFICPKEFLAKAPELEFDLCLLDIEMPQMEGIVIAQILQNKPIIFISGADDKFRAALDLAPIDIVPKPLLKDRLYKAYQKAYDLLATKKEFEVFNVAESSKKVKLRLKDILLVTTDEVDPRHKKAWLSTGETFTLMNCTLAELLNHSPTLVQVNKAELVSLDAVNEVEYDLVTLKGVRNTDNKPKQVTIGAAYKKGFKERMFFE